MKKNIGFYIFFCLIIAVIGVIGWVIWEMVREPEAEPISEIPPEAVNYIRTQAPSRDAVKKADRETASLDIEPTRERDNQKLVESLEEGFIPTQEVGEMGSREGVLVTKYPMNYKPTKYERIENSPLLLFTDDMIRKTGDNTYSVKRDAIADQAYHYQEAAIALSISPRMKEGQIDGFRFVEIPDGTLFSKLGMTSGDVLLSINGTLPDMEPMALAFMTMVAGKQGKSTIVVEHKNKKRTIQIQATE